MLIGLTYDLRDDYRDRGLSEEALEEFDNHPMRCVRCFGRGTIKCLMCGGTGELQLAPARLAAQRARGHSAAGYDHRTSTCTCTRCDGKTEEACSECCGYGLC